MYGWAWSIRLSFCDCWRDIAMVTVLGSDRRKNPTFILCIGIPQRICGRIATWMRVNTADDPSMSNKNLANFDFVTSEFCRGVCAGRSTPWALSCISSCCCFAIIAILDDQNLKILSLFVGHQLSRLGEHHVLRPRRTFLLGLDVLCRSNRGKQFYSGHRQSYFIKLYTY